MSDSTELYRLYVAEPPSAIFAFYDAVSAASPVAAANLGPLPEHGRRLLVAAPDDRIQLFYAHAEWGVQHPDLIHRYEHRHRP